MTDRVVYPKELRQILDRSRSTLNRWQKDGDLPAFDIKVNRKSKAWLASTLRASGYPIPDSPVKEESQSAHA